MPSPFIICGGGGEERWIHEELAFIQRKTVVHNGRFDFVVLADEEGSLVIHFIGRRIGLLLLGALRELEIGLADRAESTPESKGKVEKSFYYLQNCILRLKS